MLRPSGTSNETRGGRQYDERVTVELWPAAVSARTRVSPSKCAGAPARAAPSASVRRRLRSRQREVAETGLGHSDAAHRRACAAASALGVARRYKGKVVRGDRLSIAYVFRLIDATPSLAAASCATVE